MQSHRKENIYNNPQLLRIYLYYRLMLSIALYFAFIGNIAPNILGSRSPNLFQQVSFGYTLLCISSFFVFRVEHLTNSKRGLSILLIFDIVALTLLIHASGGAGSSLAYLLLVSAAMASIFLQGITALGYAALIFFLVMGNTFLIVSQEGDMSSNVFAAGTLGFLVFITTLSFNYLTEKIRLSDLIAAQKTQHAAQLQQLAQHIVTRMRTGVIVIDNATHIELINQSALQMLDLNRAGNYIGVSIQKLSNLGTLIVEWQKHANIEVPKLHKLRDGQEVRISFASLDAGNEVRTILYLEDYRAIAQHAQQLKLASLGRLAASIAHEVRNPLGAISHAAQLLSESNTLHTADTRLTEIILQHSDRVNQIIQNTLNISSRKEPKPQQLELVGWLMQFKDSYCPSGEFNLLIEQQALTVRAKFDPTHLHQVITNLCDNGCRYSKQATGKAQVSIEVGISENEELPYLEVIDDGPGVSSDMQSQIFDPFYTTDEKGSGLGLYISKELCEINQANLFYKKNLAGKSCFRINFSHHQRMI